MSKDRLPWRQLLFLATLVLLIARPIGAVDFTVDSLLDIADNSPGDGVCAGGSFSFCTLRAAIMETNALATADTITLPSGRHVLTRPGINEDLAVNGDLDITDDLEILGQGADQTTVDAGGLDRVFHLPYFAAGIEVTIESLTVTGGVAADPAPINPAHEYGGGVLVQGSSDLEIRHVRIAGNRARRGGGISGAAPYRILLYNCEVTGNRIEGDIGFAYGAGLHSISDTDTRVIVSHSSFSDNACLNHPPSHCLAGLNVRQNAPLSTDGLFLYNSTVSGNRGDGLAVYGTHAVIINSTLYGNDGHGLELLDTDAQPDVAAVQNTIIANNGIADCSLGAGILFLQGKSNLSTDTTCDLAVASGDLIEDPDLHPLGLYPSPAGWIAPSHHPRWGSPVVDAGMLVPAIDTDQDGHPRPNDGELPPANQHDIGAIEVLPCAGDVDLVLANQTLSSGLEQACRSITAEPDVIINGSVALAARESIAIGSGFEVRPGSVLTVELLRDAGAP